MRDDQAMSSRAILLLGPTSSGKTPLGEYLEQHGLWGRRCMHFDFGAHLRAVAAGELHPEGLSAQEMAVVVGSLRTGALLEDAQFPIAAKILRDFMQRRHVGPNDWIILNGLPRHAGQARDVGKIVEVIAVVALECQPEVVLARVRCNAGGDRTGRSDDDLEAVRRKLDIYRQRTEPLIEHYHNAGRRVYRIDVASETQPEDVHRGLSAEPQPAAS